MLEATTQPPEAEIAAEIVAEPAHDVLPEQVSAAQLPTVTVGIPKIEASLLRQTVRPTRLERVEIAIPKPQKLHMAPVFEPKITQPIELEIVQAETAVEISPESVAASAKSLEHQPDTTTVTTFEELLALISAPAEEDPELPVYLLELSEPQLQIEPGIELELTPEPAELYEAFVQDEVVALQSEPAEGRTFEEIISARPRPEIVPTIDEVLLVANDQPLEETFVQLSLSIENLVEAGAAPEDQSPAVQAIHDALRDIIDLLSPQEAEVATDQKSQEPIEITPELTEKLLVLLQVVGYDNPEQVLADFIEKNSLNRLVQSIHYLYEQYDDSHRAEFDSVLRVSFSPTATDDSLSSRLGRAMLKYFFLVSPVLQR